jgi:hypothetical protein
MNAKTLEILEASPLYVKSIVARRNGDLRPDFHTNFFGAYWQTRAEFRDGSYEKALTMLAAFEMAHSDVSYYRTYHNWLLEYKADYAPVALQDAA